MATMIKDFKGGFGKQELDLKKGDKVTDKNLIMHLKRFDCIKENKKKGK